MDGNFRLRSYPFWDIEYDSANDGLLKSSNCIKQESRMVVNKAKLNDDYLGALLRVQGVPDDVVICLLKTNNWNVSGLRSVLSHSQGHAAKKLSINVDLLDGLPQKVIRSYNCLLFVNLHSLYFILYHWRVTMTMTKYTAHDWSLFICGFLVKRLWDNAFYRITSHSFSILPST